MTKLVRRRRLFSELLESRRLLAAHTDLDFGDPGLHDHIAHQVGTNGHSHHGHDHHDHDHDGPCNCDVCQGHVAASGHDHAHQVDALGNEFFADPAPNIPASDLISSAPVAGVRSTASTVAVAGGVPALESKPGADQTIFLDFDGQVVSGTYWNNMNDGLPIHAQPYSTDGDVNNFSSSELSRIEEIFRRVAEDFAPFDVNVTTIDPGDAAMRAGGKALRVLISTDVDSSSMGGTGNRWFEGAGGVAYLGSWNWSSDTPVWVFENNLGNGNEKYVAEAASHEAGHAFGLRHDGNSSTGYYQGHGSGEVAWAPIMGVGYNRPLSQWSRGEYSGANNTEDDIAVIASLLGTEADDHGGTTATASSLVADATGQFIADGLISTRDDVDYFSFDTAGGDFQVDASPFDLQDGKANLDISLQLLDATGSLIASANPSSLLSASLSATVAAGRYFLTVDGVGHANPATNGYSDYGSLGWYDLVGSFVVSDDGDDGGGDPDVPAAIDFREFTVGSYGGSQDRSKTSSVSGDGAELSLSGNSWRKIDLDYNVTPDTVLSFEFASDNRGEIHGIGLDRDLGLSSNLTFKLHGSQGWGIRDYDNYSGSGWQSFQIEVGEFYTGQMSYLFFVNDHDVSNPSASGQFRNVRLYESNGPSNAAPSATDDVTEVTAGDSVVIDVLANDSDPDGDTLTITGVSQPTSGSVTIEGGELLYQSASGFAGSQSFVYQISDGRGGTAEATVTVTVNPPPTDGLIDFQANDIQSYGGNQDSSGTAVVSGNGTDLTLRGNTWKKVDFPYDVTANTVLEFEFASDSRGEIHGIGFDTNDSLSSNRTFKVYGTQTWGLTTGQSYSGGGGFQSFRIPVGDYYSGTFDRLFFVNDHDVRSPNAHSTFRNVRVYEQVSAGGLTVDDIDQFLASLSDRLDHLRQDLGQGFDWIVQRLERLFERLAAETTRPAAPSPQNSEDVAPVSVRFFPPSDKPNTGNSMASWRVSADQWFAGLR